MANQGFTEQRFDYSVGRENAPELIVMVGIGGSGKSTLAKGWVNKAYGQMVRVNRDNIRAMAYCDVPWNSRLEDLVRDFEREAARMALMQGKDCIVDDTNLVRRTRFGWEEFAKELRVKCRIVTMTTPLDECIERDSKRVGKEQLGKEIILKQHKQFKEFAIATHPEPATLCRPVWERDALVKGGFTRRLAGAKFVLCDIDGTLASHEGHRSPYDEKKVLLDDPREVVVEWVKALYEAYNVVIVSGRHDTCGDDTCEWLEGHGVPFDHILMRRGGDNRPDYIIKKEILDEVLQVLQKEEIAFVLDDRPQVVQMWKANGLTVYPVQGTTVHSPNCTFQPEKKGWRKCPVCWALEAF